MRAITLDGFERTFRDDADPWRTFSDRDEAAKRAAILHALGPGPLGRVLELGAGAGANSVALAPRALRLDATEGTAAGVALVARALAGRPRARPLRLPLPGRFPQRAYDAVVIAELLYYLPPRAMAQVAREVPRTLAPGGRLVMAHHHVDFHDFAQHAKGLHARFLRLTGVAWRLRCVRRTRRWSVVRLTRLGRSAAAYRGGGNAV